MLVSRAMKGRGPGTTTAPGATTTHDAGEESDRILGLVLLWSLREPARAGEVALVDRTSKGRAIGRGPHPEVIDLVRQRPGKNELCPPLDAPTVSRRQLALAPRSGAIVAENVGRCAVSVNGARVDKAVLVAGDLVELKNEALFLVVERPRVMEASKVARSDDARPFGAPGADGIVGESEAAHRLRDSIAFAAQASGHVLLTGESGTGKELTARAVHAESGRAKGSFVSRNAATLPSGIVDAELFGNAKNYPNSGVPERAGLVGEAHGGTLFLDEIGELPAELQAHLLRFLDAGEYHRLGESTARRSDVRVIGATNRDPASLKHDLLARFTLRIATPPLSERREDIPLLARHMLGTMAARAPALFSRFRDEGGEIRLGRGLVERLVRATWRGNLRELETVLWAAVEESPRDRIDRSSRLSVPMTASPSAEHSTPPAARTERDGEPTADEIRKAAKSAQGNLTIAARTLGLNRFALYRLLRRYGIDAETLRSG